jgi:hypothetical protein
MSESDKKQQAEALLQKIREYVIALREQGENLLAAYNNHKGVQ